jgi:hypothetical protein
MIRPAALLVTEDFHSASHSRQELPNQKISLLKFVIGHKLPPAGKIMLRFGDNCVSMNREKIKYEWWRPTHIHGANPPPAASGRPGNVYQLSLGPERRRASYLGAINPANVA